MPQKVLSAILPSPFLGIDVENTLPATMIAILVLAKVSFAQPGVGSGHDHCMAFSDR